MIAHNIEPSKEQRSKDATQRAKQAFDNMSLSMKNTGKAIREFWEMLLGDVSVMLCGKRQTLPVKSWNIWTVWVVAPDGVCVKRNIRKHGVVLEGAE